VAVGIYSGKIILRIQGFYTRSVTCTIVRNIPVISPLLVCKRSIRIISGIALRGHLMNLFWMWILIFFKAINVFLF